MSDLIAFLKQNLNAFHCQRATADYHDTTHITKIIEYVLVIGNSAQSCYTYQVCSRTRKMPGTCSCGKQQAVVTNLFPVLQMDSMLINLDIYYPPGEEMYLLILVKTLWSHPEFIFRYAPCQEILEHRAIVDRQRVVGDDCNIR